MKSLKYLLPALLAVSTLPAAAQDEEGSKVILPPEAMSCNLPSAPARIPEEADYDALVKAKGNVSQFQEELGEYRACLDASKASADLTEGNHVALTQAFNYSVEMEERVAEQFNVAVRAFKARQEAAGGD